METRPVFYLDEDVVDEDDEDFQPRPTSPYGSLQDIYMTRTPHPRDLARFRRPLPAIPGKFLVFVMVKVMGKSQNLVCYWL